MYYLFICTHLIFRLSIDFRMSESVITHCFFFSIFLFSQKKNVQDTCTPVVNRKRRESKPTPPEREFSKRTNIMNSPDNSQHQDLSFIQHNQPPLPQSTSPSFSSSQLNPVNCSLS